MIFSSPALSFALALCLALAVAAGLQLGWLRHLPEAVHARRVAGMELLGQLLLAVALAGFAAGYADVQRSLLRLQAMAEADRDAEQLRGSARVLLTHECANPAEDDDVFRRPKFGFCLRQAGGPEQALMPTAPAQPDGCPPEVDEFLQCRNYLPAQARLCSAARRVAESAAPFLETRAFAEVLRAQSRFTLCPQSGVALEHALALSIRLDERDEQALKSGTVREVPDAQQRPSTGYLWLALVFGVAAIAMKLALALDRWRPTPQRSTTS